MLEPALPSLDAQTSLTLTRCSNQPYPLDARCSNPRSMLEPALPSLDARNRALDISSALLIRVRVPASSSNRDVALNLYRSYLETHHQ